MDYMDIGQMIITPDVISAIPVETATRYRAIPVGFSDTGLIVAISDLWTLRPSTACMVLNREIELACSSEEQIRQAWVKYYGTLDDVMKTYEGADDLETSEMVSTAGDRQEMRRRRTPSSRWSPLLILEAYPRAGERYSHRAAGKRDFASGSASMVCCRRCRTCRRNCNPRS